LALNVVLWGIATACTAAAFNYQSLLAARIVLGIFEASIAPCLMLISGQWYTKSEQAPRFSFWYCGLGVGQILGGLVSFAFQHVTSTSFSGWKAMFVVLGLITSLIGVLCFFVLPDTPMTAKFLTEAEKSAILKHVSVNQTGIENKNFKFSQVLEVLTDGQLWLMTLITVLVSTQKKVKLSCYK
jgi:MFS family permease